MDDQARIQQTVKRPVKAVQALAAEWLETCSPFRQRWQELAGGRLQCNLNYKYPLNWYAGIIRLVQADQTSTLVIWELPSYVNYADPADNPKRQMVVDIAEAFDEFLAELQTDQQPGEVPAADGGQTLVDYEDGQRPWELIPDHNYDQIMIELWCKGHSAEEIARRIGKRHHSRTIYNRLSVVRRQYPNARIPTDQERWKSSK